VRFDCEPGFGFEDWEWHKRTVAEGALHVTVPRTASFVRRRSHSLNARSVNEKRLTLPSSYERGLALHPLTKSEWFKAAPIGGWLEEQWKDAHTLDAELWPTPREVEKRTMFIPDTLGSADELRLAVKALEGFDHVIVAPWLSVGGADLQIIEHARAAIEHGRRVVVVCTDDTLKSTWADKTNVTVIDLTTLVPTKRARPAALLHALLANAPATLHVVNSAMGWLLLREHGRAFRQLGTRVVVSLFCEDRVPPSGRRFGYAYDGSFARAQEHIDVVLTDNARFQKAFADEFGCEVKLVQIPVEADPALHLRHDPACRRYLWASRFDFQKGVGILSQIASANPQCTFEVRGAALVEGKLPPPVKAAREAIERMANVIVIPGQWTWEAIAKENKVYAGFLYTAQWDGMPNVVLEAAARGLPVVSTDVGDVSKLTGSAVALGAEAWVWAEMFERVASNGYVQRALQTEYLKENHNEERFIQQLEEAGYL
jgi:glycosyltransferase involved in cell wall biosynthesis